jgi:hypothetical protein
MTKRLGPHNVRAGEGDAVTGLLSPWKDRVLDAIARVVARGGRADLLGTW